MSEPKSDTQLNVTMARVRDELKSKGKTNVKLASEAAGSSKLAAQIITTAGDIEGLKIETKENKASVSGKVVKPDDKA